MPYTGLSYPASGLLPLAQAVARMVDDDPLMLAKSMQLSGSPEVREYGHRIELALVKSGFRKKPREGAR